MATGVGSLVAILASRRKNPAYRLCRKRGPLLNATYQGRYCVMHIPVSNTVDFRPPRLYRNCHLAV